MGVGATYCHKVVASMAGRTEGSSALLWRKDLQLNINSIFIKNKLIIFNISITGYNIAFNNAYINSDLWKVSTQAIYEVDLSKLDKHVNDLQYDKKK